MKLDNSIIICADSKEQTEKRNICKKCAKAEGLFLRVERNTVVLKDGRAVSFVIGEVMDFEDEHLPNEAFE